jgi:hypothetical protein
MDRRLNKMLRMHAILVPVGERKNIPFVIGTCAVVIASGDMRRVAVRYGVPRARRDAAVDAVRHGGSAHIHITPGTFDLANS